MHVMIQFLDKFVKDNLINAKYVNLVIKKKILH